MMVDKAWDDAHSEQLDKLRKEIEQAKEVIKSRPVNDVEYKGAFMNYERAVRELARLQVEGDHRNER